MFFNVIGRNRLINGKHQTHTRAFRFQKKQNNGIECKLQHVAIKNRWLDLKILQHLNIQYTIPRAVFTDTCTCGSMTGIPAT
ncbi:Uncharacterised protein [Klebsiella pneumoniae]|uniref:Uncharacterized protein n=1 Tax=Klebsiella pneumoniae TaxID=573 RepID=A0A2X3DCP4_KLEPN|nr:Uncharacterised protein [Klebsiella pneumoniae]